MARVAELSAEITAETGDFERGLSNVEKAIKGTRTTIGGLDKDIKVMGTNMGSANDALHALGVSLPITPMAALGTGVRIVGDQMKAAVNETVDYAKQVRDLGRSIGATAEQTSMLIQAADDVQVSFGSLSAALEAGIRKGVEPTIEGIGKLADEYNAIQDPIARTKFLMDNFGRSGADLAPLMEQGAAGIAELGANAKATGLVLSGEGVQSAREYEKALDAAEESVQALKLAVGQKLIPPLTAVMDNFSKGQVLVRKWDEALAAGVITSGEADEAWFRLHGGITSVDDELARVTTRLKPVNDALAKAAAHYEDYGVRATHAARQVKDAERGTTQMGGALEKAGKAAHGAAGGLKEVGKAAEQSAGGFDRFSDAMTDAALSGVMQAAQEDYLSVIKETTPEIDKLTAQIKKYQAAQGQSFTVTEDATTSAAEYELATIKAATAAQKLAEFTGDNREEYLGLVLASDRAAESVGKLGEGFGFTKEFTADYTKKIQEANGTLDELNAKQAAAEEALRKTTAEFVLQQAASSLTGQALLDFAHNTGLMDDASYNLAGQIQFQTGVWDLNKNGIIDVGREQDGLSRSLAELTTRTVAQTVKQSESLPVLEDTSNKMYDIRDAAHEAGGAVEKIPTKVETIDTGASVVQMESLRERAQAVRDTIAGIERNIDINTNFFTHGTPGGGGRGDFYGDPGPGGANGLNFVVPPGYPNDSFPVRVQSGEHVQVTPAGQAPKNSGGVTVNQYINTTMPASSAVLLQTARAVMGGT